MDWEITIKRVDNGYIIEIPSEEFARSIDGKDITETIISREVIETTYNTGDADEYGTDDEDKISFTKVIEHIADYFGFHHEKYNKNNLKITWGLKGSKVMDDEDDKV